MIHDVERRMNADATFRRVVDLMARMIEDADYSPDDARAAMLCALIQVESRRAAGRPKIIHQKGKALRSMRGLPPTRRSEYGKVWNGAVYKMPGGLWAIPADTRLGVSPPPPMPKGRR